jgi:hypothetical protein
MNIRFVGLVSVLALNLSAFEALADGYYVVESNVDDFKVGEKISDTQLQTLPKGSRVRVLLPENKTKLFEVPDESRNRTIGGTRGMK